MIQRKKSEEKGVQENRQVLKEIILQAGVQITQCGG